MDLSKHTRRDFLRLAGLSAATVAVAACAGQPQVVEKIVKETVEVVKEVEKQVTVVVEKEAEAPVVVASKYKESPMLAERVAKGELPPVDERLPEEPRVTQVLDGIGMFGGTLTVGDLSTGITGGDADQSNGDWGSNWGRISHDLTKAEPNVLKEFSISDDLTVFTGTMRKGMKWSDGEPLTTADLKYWYEDMLSNKEITPLAHMDFRWGGEQMKLDIIDDYNFKLTFAQPHAHWILVNVAHYYGFWGGSATWVPAHYMKQFHIKYNDKANDLAKAGGFDFWYQYHGQRNNVGQNIDRPKLTPFIPVRDTPQMTFSERNPYYYGVDAEGNQLPYIDKLQKDRAADLSILDAKIVGGQYDFVAFQMRILFYATYNDGAAASNAHIKLWNTGKGSEVVYNFNSNWPDEEWRNIFQDDRFHHAMSLALNRADINNVIYFGNASETQMTVIPSSRHYKPEYAQAYAAYDVEEANRLLDELGLAWNAEKTHRLWPVSKKPMVVSWDLVETETPKGPITELVTEYWKAVGYEIQWKSITRNLLTQKLLANEEPMSLWHGDETADTLFLRRPKYFAPIDGDENTWGVLWGRWYNTKGDQGEEPPQVIKDLYVWLDEYNITDSDEPARKVLESQMEHVWTLGSVGNAPHPLFVRNTLKNVSETGGFWTWDSLWAFPEYSETWYFEQ
jgi:peptide/nickel transport system substrate-binding protein